MLSKRRFQATTVLILIASSLFLLWNLGGYSLINVTEARQAEIARQMWLTHDWITPSYNGEPYFDKPALLHWLIALGFTVFGPQEWVVRLPSAVNAIALLTTTWFFFSATTTRRLALFTTGILAANPFTWALGRIGFHDMLMAFLMTLALYLWFWADQKQQKAAYLFSFGSLALATLAKGPLALLLCLLILPLFYLWTGNWRQRAKQVPWGWGILVFGTLASPWYFLVIQANGWDYIRYFFGDSNVSRFLSVNQNQWGPPYYYLLALCFFFFPWVIQLPSAIWKTVRQRWSGSTRPLDQFMVVWGLTVLIFMSLAATKLSWYLYPGLPAFAYLSARAWDQPQHRWPWATGLMAVSYAAFAIAISTGNLGDPNLLLSLEAAHLRWIWVGVFAIAAVAAVILKRQAAWVVSIGIITFGCISFTSAQWLMPVLDTQTLDRQIIPVAKTLKAINRPTEITATLGLSLPSLNFYSGLTHIERFEDACQIPERLNQAQRLLLITTADALSDEKLTFSAQQMRQQSGRFCLIELSSADQAEFKSRLKERCVQQSNE
ncbi:MAG: glycosyltransferase family 39 protein [Thermosynechococcaceae cyanobacterium]